MRSFFFYRGIYFFTAIQIKNLTPYRMGVNGASFKNNDEEQTLFVKQNELLVIIHTFFVSFHSSDENLWLAALFL